MSDFRKEIVERAAQMMVERLDGDDSDGGQSVRTSDADGEAAYFKEPQCPGSPGSRPERWRSR